MASNEVNICLPAESGKSNEEVYAKFITSPQTTAAVVQREFSVTRKGDLDLPTLTRLLSRTCHDAAEGSHERSAMVLAAQAEALNAIFTKLATSAAANMGEGYLGATDTYMRLALKAQSQSKSTLEALSRIQNPRLASYVSQLNATTGPQQVNNPGATKIKSMPNELMEKTDGEWVDRGAEGSPIKRNSKVEPLVQSHGAAYS